MNFIWIDDNPDREVSANNLAKTLNVECPFINVKGKDVSEPLLELLKLPEPDLIFIDQNLIDSVTEEESKGMLIRKGSSAATIIREHWKGCPIICVSGDAEGLNSVERAIYEEVYPDHKISDFYVEILAIATGFNLIRKNRPSSTAELLKLLEAPEVDLIKLSAIVPKQLKENFTDSGVIVEISNWVRKILMTRPGFLYDELWAATYLGLTIDGFNKVKSKFQNAEYKGVFANNDSPRWWKSGILRCIGELISQPGLPAQKARGLMEIDEKDYCVCSVTKEPFPETVAFVDDTPSSPRSPMKIKVTAPHKDYEKMLYFEEIRLMLLPE